MWTKKAFLDGRKNCATWSSDKRLTAAKLDKYSVEITTGIGIIKARSFAELVNSVREMDDDEDALVCIVTDDGTLELIDSIEVDHLEKCVYITTDPCAEYGILLDEDDETEEENG